MIGRTTGLGLVLMLVLAATGRADEKDERISELTKRLETLEKLVIKDTFHPDRTVLSRLDAVEQKAQALNKADAADAKSDAKIDEAVQKALKDTQRTLDGLERRLRTVEQAKPADVGGDVKDLRRDVRTLQTLLDGLKDRVSKLEARVR